MTTSTTGIDLIKSFEGFRGEVYLCPAGFLTIGYGSTLGVTKDTPPITEPQAVELLSKDLKLYESAVRSNVKVPLTQSQFDALVSFTYNVGPGNFKVSTMLKKLNAKDYSGASAQFLVWNKSNGKVLEGLNRRRKAERELFDRGEQS